MKPKYYSKVEIAHRILSRKPIYWHKLDEMDRQQYSCEALKWYNQQIKLKP